MDSCDLSCPEFGENFGVIVTNTKMFKKIFLGFIVVIMIKTSLSILHLNVISMLSM